MRFCMPAKPNLAGQSVPFEGLEKLSDSIRLIISYSSSKLYAFKIFLFYSFSSPKVCDKQMDRHGYNDAALRYVLDDPIQIV